MAKKQKRKAVTAYTTEGEPVMEVFAIKRDGDKLIIDGKALGSMTMDVVISIDEIARGIDIVLKKDVFRWLLMLPGALLRNRRNKKHELPG